MKPGRQQLGNRGERIAIAHLKRRGYTILATNWRCPRGEIDIVAGRGERLTFVEVRTRRAPTTEAAFESIDARKQARLAGLAHAYLEAHGFEDALWQVDVIAVALPRGGPPIVEHVENALGW